MRIFHEKNFHSFTQLCNFFLNQDFFYLFTLNLKFILFERIKIKSFLQDQKIVSFLTKPLTSWLQNNFLINNENAKNQKLSYQCSKVPHQIKNRFVSNSRLKFLTHDTRTAKSYMVLTRGCDFRIHKNEDRFQKS